MVDKAVFEPYRDMDQLNFVPIGQELNRHREAENECDRLPDAEFLATPLHLLANDLTSPPIGEGVGGGVTQPQAQSPGSCPAFPGRSTPSQQKIRNMQNLEPERSLEWDNLRQIKHADPYGRVTLGRKFSFRTFIVEALTDGAFLLRPAVIMEQRQFESIRRASSPLGERACEERTGVWGKCQSTPIEFLRCPTMRKKTE